MFLRCLLRSIFDIRVKLYSNRSSVLGGKRSDHHLFDVIFNPRWIQLLSKQIRIRRLKFDEERDEWNLFISI